MSLAESGSINEAVGSTIPLAVRADIRPVELGRNGLIYSSYDRVDFQSTPKTTPPKTKSPSFPTFPRPTNDAVRKPAGGKRPPLKRPGQIRLPWA